MPKETKSQGFGDDIEKVAKKLGLDRVANTVAKAAGKEDCGCSKRRDALNKMFPYKNNNQQDESK
jgi:ABC-type hemin transport system substrate-binding protein